MTNQKKSTRRKVSCPFKPGDLVTGKDRSYKRSIYKMLEETENPEVGLFEYQSLGFDVVQSWKDNKARISQYQVLRTYDEFRFANDEELKDSKSAKVNYSLRRLLIKLGMEFCS